uniref:Transmembrane protein family 132 fourth domain-containing protein n=1 Tax=Timema cristinae TaxID=61476 RepID=A0A7R9D0U0_TIMCR|nr:unnamed protein product [Timema cristinae]
MYNTRCVVVFQSWGVMNTAVLTGRQVSQAMKVFIVSQAGKVADVTLQSSCHSEDESVLKNTVKATFSENVTRIGTTGHQFDHTAIVTFHTKDILSRE